MFGIGPWEIVVIVIVALIFIRPSDLPAVLRKAGRFFTELRSLRDDVTRSLSEVEHEVEREIQSAAIEPESTPAKHGGNGQDAKGGPPGTADSRPGEDARREEDS